MTATTIPKPLRWLWLGLGIAIPALILAFVIWQSPAIQFDTTAAKIVDKTSLQFAWSEHQYWYIWINIGVICFPFLLSFDKRVHFYKKWRYALPSVFANAAFFIPWDALYTALGVWGFNDRYYDGLLWGLPYGEWLFFITVPYACLFVHECFRVYITRDVLAPLDALISFGLIGLFLLVGFWQLDKIYTAWAFLLSGGLLLAHYLVVPNSYRTRFYLAFLVCLVPFLLTNGILTGAVNQEPIVIYNDAHNLTSVLGARLITIPYDDFAYGFLLIFVPVLIFEELRAGTQ